MVTWLAGPVVNLACQLARQHYAPAAPGELLYESTGWNGIA
jgi:hypothetical protein